MDASDVKWEWTDTFMRWLTGCAVLLCAVGFVAPSVSLQTGDINWVAAVVGVFLSGACALCLLLSNASAANAQLYFSTGRWASGLGAVAIFAGGGLVSMTSMHMGWTVFSGWAASYSLPNEQQMSWAFGFVAFVKPAVNWNIQALKDIRREREKEEDANRQAAEIARLERLKQPTPVDRPADRPQVVDQSPVRRLKLVESPASSGSSDDFGRAAVASTAAVVVAGGHANALPAEPVDVQPPQLQPVQHSEQTFASPEAHARHLITAENVGKRNELARRVRGLSTYRAAQLLDELSPGWRRPTAA